MMPFLWRIKTSRCIIKNKKAHKPGKSIKTYLNLNFDQLDGIVGHITQKQIA
jgi:hypothetical protein